MIGNLLCLRWPVAQNRKVKARQFAKLLELPVAAQDAAMLEGLQLLVENVRNLADDATTLHEVARYGGAAIMDGLAAEEAAKAFMLLDVVRAGRYDQKVASRVLRSWLTNHMARGLYVRAYDGRPADLREVRAYLDTLRRERFLDGPNDVDWVFRNEIRDTREGLLYVDYVVDEHNSGSWVTPAQRPDVAPDMVGWGHLVPQIVQLMPALERLGLFTDAGMVMLRRVWSQAPKLEETTHWTVVEELNHLVIEGLIDADLCGPEATAADARQVINGWCFPLTSLDMGVLTVTDAEIAAKREAWLRAQV